MQPWTPGRSLLNTRIDMPPAAMFVFPRETRMIEVLAIMNQAALTADLNLAKIIKQSKQPDR